MSQIFCYLELTVILTDAPGQLRVTEELSTYHEPGSGPGAGDRSLLPKDLLTLWDIKSHLQKKEIKLDVRQGLFQSGNFMPFCKEELLKRISAVV